MFLSKGPENKDLRIRRLQAECGCEAGAIALLSAFAISTTILYFRSPAGLSIGRWLAAAVIAVAVGAAAKLAAIAYARRELRMLVAMEEES